MTNITDTAIDAFNAYARANDLSDPDFDLRDMISRISTYTMRADLTDDMTMLHFDLDDELHDLNLIAFHDRDSMTLTSLILNSDTDTTIIL